jgi:hypothetical protein
VNFATENDPPPPALLDLFQQRQQYHANLSQTAPSTMALASNFSTFQEDPDQRIVWARPPNADETIPVVLYHRIMRDFIDDCNNHQPIDKDNNLVLQLTDSMSRFFPKEENRTDQLLRILHHHGIPTTSPPVKLKFQTDAAIQFGRDYLLSIFEVKAEIGSTGAEPHAQAVLYYAHQNSKKAAENPTFKPFNFPCLIVTIFGLTSCSSLLYNTYVLFSGPHISFSGAVWKDRPHFQVLTPTIPLFCHQSDTDMRESLARHFGAFKKAIRSLEQCYKALENPAVLADLDPRFPDPRTYRSLETDCTVKFEYIDQIDQHKLLFFGKTDNGESICIKFVRRYSRAAHEKCATMGIAPNLRGFQGIGAGWTMVIMDALNEEYKTFNKNSLPADTRENMEAGLTELHQAHFVHGDVRDVNVMVRKDGKPGFMLVDFDWAGINGEVRYPANVNKELWRPEDVADGMPIRSEHDMMMLDRMFR